MGFFRKEPEPEMLKTTEKVMPKAPEPPIFLDLKERLDRLEALIIEHHRLTMEKLEPQPEVVVLDDKELKLIPEEDKDYYLNMKKDNPKMAERLLKGYESGKGK